MAQPPTPSIREVLLEEIKAREPKTQIDAPLSQRSVLDGASRRLRGHDAQAILTQWSELFRTGLLAWGLDLSNPDPPFFHLTERGRKALENATRDPSNPVGYLRHLEAIAKLEAVVKSYLLEALDCYVAGLYKAAAVMVGAAAEKIVLDLRDLTSEKLIALGRVALPKGMELEEWRVKTVSDSLRRFFDEYKRRKQGTLGAELSDAFEGYWSAFTLQIRATRNDAGHPTSIEPITPDTVHASLLIFPAAFVRSGELLAARPRQHRALEIEAESRPPPSPAV